MKWTNEITEPGYYWVRNVGEPIHRSEIINLDEQGDVTYMSSINWNHYERDDGVVYHGPLECPPMDLIN